MDDHGAIASPGDWSAHGPTALALEADQLRTAVDSAGLAPAAKEALDKELAELSTSLTGEREKLKEIEAKLVKLQASEFDDPLKVVSAGLDDDVLESQQAKDALAVLARLQGEATERRRAAAATPEASDPGVAGGAPAGGGVAAADKPANGGDGDDIDMDLLGGEGFEQKQADLNAAMAAMRAAGPEQQDEAKRKPKGRPSRKEKYSTKKRISEESIPKKASADRREGTKARVAS